MVGGIVRDHEIMARTAVHMAHHDVKTAVLKMKIGIDIHPRIIAEFRAPGFVLHGISPDHRGVCRSIVLGIIRDVRSDFGAQDFRYAKE